MNPLYYYNGSLRWSLYWENPNCWAAFLVFVFVGLWTIQRSLRVARASRLQTGCVPHPALPGRGWWRGVWRGSGRLSSAGGTPALPAAFLIAAYAVEAGAWFLLVKTYSRGGLVTAVVALGVYFGLSGLRGLRGTGDSPVGSSSTGFQPVGFQDKTRAGRPCHTNHTGESPVPLEHMGWQPIGTSLRLT